MRPTRSIDEVLRNPARGEPAWGLALLYPEQGGWTEEEYLGLISPEGPSGLNSPRVVRSP